MEGVVFGLALIDRFSQEHYGRVTFLVLTSPSSINGGSYYTRKGKMLPEKAIHSTGAAL